MSDYDISESSIDDGSPFELYEWLTPEKNYYHTTDAIGHTHAVNYYVPIAGLKRHSMKVATHEDSDNSFSIEMPISVDLAKAYALSITPPRLQLNIYRYHRTAATFVQYWGGEINGVSVRGEVATFKALSDFSGVMSATFPTLAIQPPCNNVLFDSKCQVSRIANSKNTSVISVSGASLVVASVSGFAANWFVGGEVISGVERRSIMSQSGTTLNLNYPFAINPVGKNVQLAAGCDHSYNGSGGCPKFSNKPNFGGFPYAPGEGNNPFTQGV
jgi:uncharacterized phage protein (TIGR02218 family)